MKGLHESEAPFLMLWLMTVVQYRFSRKKMWIIIESLFS